jgi:hypothetical protein
VPPKNKKEVVPERAVVTFPLHVRADVWQRFKEALGKDQSAHGVLTAFVERYGRRKRPVR